MDIRQLTYFVRIVEEGSFIGAAGSLNIAQSALSYHIKQLEEELRVKLLDRHSRGIVPTAAGRILLAKANAALKEFGSIRPEVWAYARYPMGEVAVAAPPSVTRMLGALLVEQFNALYPDVRLTIREAAPALVTEWLVQGSVDLAILYDVRHQTGWLCEPLTRDRLHVIASPQLPPLSEGGISIADLCELRLVLPSAWHGTRQDIEQYLRENKLEWKVAAEVDSVTVIRDLVRHGFGYGVLPRYAVLDEIEGCTLSAIPIRDIAPANYLALCSLPHRAKSKAVQELERVIKIEVAGLVTRGWGLPLASDAQAD